MDKIRGRTLIKDEQVSLEEAVNLLENCSAETKGELTREGGFNNFRIWDVHPKEFVEYLKKECDDPYGTTFTDGQYEVHKTKSGEEHKIRLYHGRIQAEIAGETIKGDPYTRIKIQYLEKGDE